MTQLLVAGIVFLGIFTHSFTGFGLALVMMPLLSGVVGLRVAAPLVALIGLVTELIVLARYRHALNVQAVRWLALASLAGVPPGVAALSHVDEGIILPILGLVVAAYALYALLDLRLPEARHPGWAWGLGFLAGLLGGAYNVSGPPVLIYATCRRWEPAEFKGNLQGFFLLNSLVVILAHALSRNYSAPVWDGFLVALPAIGLGALAGFSLDGRVSPARFRRVTLGLLVVLGLSLIV